MWRTSWLASTVIAVLAGTVVVAVTAVAGHWQKNPLGVDGGLWIGATALPLVVRTRFPLTVFGITLASTVGYFLFSPFPPGPLPVLPMIALMTASYLRGPLVASVIGVSILVVGQLIAWRFDGSTVVILLGITAGTAIGAAVRARRERSVEHAQRVAEKERLHLAREVHDVVAHSLAMINVQAGVGAHIADKRPDQAKEALLAIKEASRVALADLRATLGVVRSGDRSPVPGLDRLPELVDSATAAGFAVERRGEPGDLPTHVSFTAYRIVQESMTNAIRHARDADRIVIEFARPDSALELVVTDNGAAPSVNVGNGLRGMRERAEALGGTLSAGPVAARGFEVRAVLPVRGES
ncbi:sensor histidine kinase [Actinocrispum wychmicini]|uniref:histidine kinase n=1 Tax=Actinocrispum wychmicini TaxID=1213861 RepID=A0A4R2JXI5_9PSEU|nr:sensor histidine kinase [Actinocrispum wychmicini]TCO64584.1 signal transduction histidine kinase [Actinocrispum wychmicini]